MKFLCFLILVVSFVSCKQETSFNEFALGDSDQLITSGEEEVNDDVDDESNSDDDIGDDNQDNSDDVAEDNDDVADDNDDVADDNSSDDNDDVADDNSSDDNDDVADDNTDDSGDSTDTDDVADDEPAIDWSEEYTGCDVRLAGTGSGGSNNSAGSFNIVVGSREKLMAALDNLAPEHKQYFIDALAGQIQYESKNLVQETSWENDAVLAFNESGTMQATRFRGSKALLFSNEKISFKATNAQSDILVSYSMNQADIRATELGFKKVIVLVERSQKNMKICSSFTGMGASLTVDADAPADGQTFFFSKTTGWEGSVFNSSLNGGTIAKHTLKGTSFRDMDVTIVNNASLENYSKIKFTGFKNSTALFTSYGQTADFLMEGTVIRDSAVRIVNQAQIKTTASNKVVHSKDKFENMELIGLGTSHIVNK